MQVQFDSNPQKATHCTKHITWCIYR